MIEIEGPYLELVELRREMAEDLGPKVVLTEVSEIGDSIFSRGTFGESAVASFLIQYGAAVAALGTGALLAKIEKIVRRRNGRRVRVTMKTTVRLKIEDSEAPSE